MNGINIDHCAEDLYGISIVMHFEVYLVFVLSCTGMVSATIEQHHADHLSTHPHYVGSDHNPEYDHDAFLGPKQAKEFEQLSEEDAKKRLGAMIPKLDTDKDGEISLKELEAWIDKQRKIFMYDAVDEDIGVQDSDGDKMISWTEYMKARFGEWEHEDFPKDEVGVTVTVTVHWVSLGVTVYWVSLGVTEQVSW